MSETLCDPMGCSMLGFPVLHSLLEFAQTHVHWVGEAIQLSHPLSSPSPPAIYLSQHLFQGFFPISWLFTSGDWRIGALASVLPMNIQGWFPLGLTGLISLQSTGLWRVLWPLYKHLELLYIIKCWIPVSTEKKVIGIWRRYKRGQMIQIFTTLVSSL